MIDREDVEIFDTLRRYGMKILDIDPELYFGIMRGGNHGTQVSDQDH